MHTIARGLTILNKQFSFCKCSQATLTNKGVQNTAFPMFVNLLSKCYPKHIKRAINKLRLPLQTLQRHCTKVMSLNSNYCSSQQNIFIFDLN